MTKSTDNLFQGKEARDGLARGVKKACDAVKLTLGAAGANAVLERTEPPFNEITNDGISIIEAMQFSDPVEAQGLALVKQVSSRSDKESGDGTTTAAVLMNAIIEEGLKVVDQIHPMQLKRELEDCIPIINASIKDQTKEITVNEVGQVAAISAEDEKMGALIQEIYQQIGKDGILYPDISKTYDDHYILGKGITIESAGFVSGYMADLTEQGLFTNTATFKNPRILITKQKLNSTTQITKLCEKMNERQEKELVIFVDEYEGIVVPNLIKLRQGNGFRVVIVKMPVLWKDWWYEDLAKLTGATVLDPSAGQSYKELGLHHLGTCGSIIIDKSDTYLDGVLDVSEYTKQLEADGTDDSKIRSARLNTKTARLFIGAHTDAALSYKKLKLTDARNAAWQALHGGICPGGGVTLLNAADYLPKTVGGSILRSALRAPIFQIIDNAGLDTDIPADGGTEGINVMNGEIVDMFEAGIVDPASVVRNSVKNAISVAATVLTASIVVTIPKPELPYMPQNSIMR